VLILVEQPAEWSRRRTATALLVVALLVVPGEWSWGSGLAECPVTMVVVKSVRATCRYSWSKPPRRSCLLTL
jgi:hypothetical protein